MKRFRNFFTLNNWKRIIILGITLITTLIAIIFGSFFYVGAEPKKSIEYGGGIEVLVQVQKNNQNADKELTDTVSNSLFQRLSGTGLTGTNITSEGDGKIRVAQSGNLNDAARRNFESRIVDKPILTITDLDVKPLFRNGSFGEDLTLETGNSREWIPPFAENSSKFFVDNTGRNAVSLNLKNSSAILEWTRATDHISKRQFGKNIILMWLNIEELLDLAKTKYADDWKASGENLYNFVHVNNMATSSIQDPTAPGGIRFVNNVMKQTPFDAKEYLISVASVSQALNTQSVIISGNFSQTEATNLANDINFGLTDYNLQVLSSLYVDSTLNNSAFNSALLAGIVVFAIIAIFMIGNYGLLGALSTFSIALYIFLTLLIFTALQSEYSPSTIAALVIGIGISVDANIITFERLKKEIYSGSSFKKSFKNSNKLSLSAILDANITTLIVAFILFYFGTRSIRGFSISLILSIVFTLIVMLIFTRFVSSMLVSTSWFDKKMWLFGIHNKYINKDNSNKRYVKYNYIKNAKWFALGSLIIIIAAGITFISIGNSSGDILHGINRSLEFRGGVNVLITGDNSQFVSLSESQANSIKDFIVDNSERWNLLNPTEVLSIQRVEAINDNFGVVLRTTQDLSQSIATIQSEISSNFNNLSITNFTISTTEARNLVLNAILAVSFSFIGIVAYTLFRMRWTFSIAAILGLVHDLIVVIAFIILTRLEMSTIMIAALLSIVGFSINDTIVTFDRIREIINSEYGKKLLSKTQIISIANKAIAETLKRSVYTTITTMASIIVLLAFQNATDFSFNIVMLFGMAIGVYSSVFICSWIWVIFENLRQKGIKRRIEKKFWHISNPEEQTFIGVNDYQV